MKDGDYIIHYKRTVVLTSDIVKEINNALKSPVFNPEDPSKPMTIWDMILKEISTITGENYENLKTKFPFTPANPTSIPGDTKTCRWRGKWK